MKLSNLAILMATFLLFAAALSCGSDDEEGDTTAADTVSDAPGLDTRPDAGCFSWDDCDDNDPCTSDVCSGGTCVNEEIVCDDDLFCNGVESCDEDTGQCLDGSPPVLDDGIFCTTDVCDEENDEVTHAADDDGCDDGNFCTDDFCDLEAGGCSSVNADGPCDDGNPCTVEDACEEGNCVGLDKTALVCDDGLWCNGMESCDEATGECIDGTAPVADDGVECTHDECLEESDEIVNTTDDSWCEDQDPCTDDVCDPEAGCTNELNTASCDDGNPCTGEDTCDEGNCSGILLPVEDLTELDCLCTADEDCEAIENSNLCDGTLVCEKVAPEDEEGVCQIAPETIPECDDGIDCTADSCDPVTGCLQSPVDEACEDGDVCTDDVCTPEAGCEHSFNTATCDDDDPCTLNDVCAEGSCAGTQKECGDGLWCNGEESCEPASGECHDGPPPSLDDSVPCTVDSCNEEDDAPVHEPDDSLCDDQDPCTDDVCTPAVGCEHSFNTATCDDGDPCTVEDLCEAGDCAGTQKECSDDLFCNGEESCHAETGDCVDGSPPVLSDEIECTVDECDEENDMVLHGPDDSLCNDDDPCTDDVCAPGAGCGYSFNAAQCEDGDPCTVEDFCAGGVCAGAPKDCLDDLFCNGEESCEEGTGICQDGTPPPVDDSIQCTVDECDEEADEVTHTVDHQVCADVNPCTDDTCVVGQGCVWEANEAVCDDDEACSANDHCADGSCQPGAWICEDCTNGLDDNEDQFIDCCDPLCIEAPECAAEADCGNNSDDDCDGFYDCADTDCHGGQDCGPYPQPGDIVVTEIMQNPLATPDTAGEWFELHNISQETFDLRFLTVTDLDADSPNEFVVADSLPIGPGEYLVLGNSDDQQANGAVAVDYEYDGMTLSNAEDEIVLTMLGIVVDQVAYDGGPLFPDPEGASMQLDSAAVNAAANDDGDNWCAARLPWTEEPAGDLGSPGAASHPCTETDCGNDGDDDFDGQTDCDDPDCGDNNVCVDTDGDGIFNAYDKCPGEPDGDDGDGDGIPDACDIAWAGNVWPNGGVHFPQGDPLTFYLQIYLDGVTNVPDQGANIEAVLLYRMAWDEDYQELPMTYLDDQGNNDQYNATIPALSVVPGAFYVDFAVRYDAGLFGKHDYNGVAIKDQMQVEAPLLYSVQAPPPAAGELIITEVMQNPAAVDDSDGEFVEIYNGSDHAISLGGLVLKDDTADDFTIAGEIVLEAGAYYLMCRNDVAEENGGISCDVKYSDFVLANKSDEVELNFEGIVVDRIVYDDGATYPDPSGASMGLSPDHLSATDNDTGGNWCEASTVFGAGDKGTPGVVNDACPDPN